MSYSIEFNNYSQYTIKYLLQKVDKSQLSQNEIQIIEDYKSQPILTLSNISIISNILNIDIDELLSQTKISTNNYKIHTILKFMTECNKQIELSYE